MKLGLVTRARNASDQRTFMVDLTAPAARLYDRMAADTLALEARMLDGLRPTDVRNLLTLLDTIEATLRSPADQRRLLLMRSKAAAAEGVAPASRPRRR